LLIAYQILPLARRKPHNVGGITEYLSIDFLLDIETSCATLRISAIRTARPNDGAQVEYGDATMDVQDAANTDTNVVDLAEKWCAVWQADQTAATPRTADAVSQSRADIDRIVATRATTLPGIKA
jgi:hypothetical protein